MRKTRHLDLTDHRIWKDKNITFEAKDIYSYLYMEGFDRTIANVNIGRIQGQIKGLKNVAFRKNLQLLEKHKYITFKEYDRGLYEYTIC